MMAPQVLQAYKEALAQLVYKDNKDLLESLANKDLQVLLV
jgi:hypothetical protein